MISRKRTGTYPEKLFSVYRYAAFHPLLTSENCWLISAAFWDKGSKQLFLGRAHSKLRHALQCDLVRCFRKVARNVVHNQSIFNKEKKEQLLVIKLNGGPCLRCDVFLVKCSDQAAIRRAPHIQILMCSSLIADLLMCDYVIPYGRTQASAQ